MEEIEAFFDFSKDFERVTVPRGCVSGNLQATAGPSLDSKPIKREQFGTDYVRQVVEEERRKMQMMDVSSDDDIAQTSRLGASSCMDNVEDLSDDDDEVEIKPKISKINDGVYEKYVFDMRRDERLPIHDTKDEIIGKIRKHPVIILEGDTGCGKTTQVPQYILDDAYRRREYCKIVCTQPRRIAAISIANRVCDERKWEVGSVVGYQVGLHANVSDDTRLLYCTTGVLLQKLIKEKSLTHYTHIILDEVHERDQEMDFLLIVIRRLLLTNSRKVKIVLMSATINTGEFAEYFTIRDNPSPVLRVDTRRLYKVREFYLSDLQRINHLNIQPEFNDPGIGTEMYNIALKLVIVIDNIEKQEASINDASSGSYNSVLIFLPGINEIDQMCRILEHLHGSGDSNIKLWPIRLHSLISPDEQRKVFNPPPLGGHRKVILATNIAESSITVPDVKYVIDFCLTKSLITDTTTNFTSLQLHWASHANCRQRAGRAGRVSNGRVYRMVSKYFYENYLDEFGTPEMLRCPLENVVLKAKLLDIDSPTKILALAMSPPNLTDITNTILMLKEIGALYLHVNDVYTTEDGDITFMGRVMANLPLDIRLTRLIMLGYIFNALDEAIIMAAGLSVRSIFKFYNERKQREIDAYIQKLVWADGSGSDLFAILKAYRIWASMREQQDGEDGELTWANRYFINLRSIKEMHLLVKELKERLIKLGIKEQTVYQRVNWIDREKTVILKIIIAGAFYPNYFIRSNLNDLERERGIYHILCGNDPCTTVFFTNFNTRHIGQLYTRTIKELFRDVRVQPKNIEIRFQPGSERVFVTFKSDPEDEFDDGIGNNRLVVPGRVRAEIYKAVRMRMLAANTSIHVMDPRAEVRFAEERKIGVMFEGVWQPNKKQMKHPELIALPAVFQKIIRGHITHIETCSKFYFQSLSETERLRDIKKLLNDKDDLETCLFRNPAAISKGMLLAAPFNNTYYRARVLQVIHSSRFNVQFKVYFIDYGNTAICDFENLRRFSYRCENFFGDIPSRAFECRLAMVQPSSVKCPNGKWPEEAMECFQESAEKGQVELEIFSVVGNVANVIMKVDSTTMNDILVEKGYARKSDENYMSKSDHDYRLRKQSVTNRFLDEDHSRQNEEYIRSIQQEIDLEVDPPPKQQCMRTIKLRGPFSPLETKVFSAIRVGTWKCVNIERDSVNSVMLDTDPQDVHERLVVAAGITETQNSESLTARATTLMPNIHGFGALMTLLFCPTMQIKRNPSKTKFVAILAGLGFDETTYEPLYGEHDILLNLDADILTDDLELINQLRYCMDSILYTPPGEECPPILPNLRDNLMAKIKTILVRLLSKNRKYIETHVDSKDNVWEHITEDIIESEQIYGKRSIFPLHSALRLYDEKFDRKHALGLHCQELHHLRQYDGSVPPTTCQLCNQSLENIVQLRIHLLSQLHRDREHQIGFKLAK